MHLEPGEEHLLIKDTVARVLRDAEDASAQGGPPLESPVWSGLAEMGIPGWLLPEGCGGMGGGGAEIIQLSRQLGQAICATPICESVMGAGHILGEAGSATQIDRWGAGLTEGTLHISLAAGAGPSGVRASYQGGQWVLKGTARHARWIDRAGAVLLIAKDGESSRCFVIDKETLPEPRTRQLADLSRMGDIGLDGFAVPPDCLIEADERIVRTALDRVRIGYAAHLSGLCDRVFDDARDYAGERRQFSVPIASFQAIRHHLARMFVSCELVQSYVLRAGLSGFGREEDGITASGDCLKYAGRKALKIAQTGVQIFGGMGITDELPVGRAHRQILSLAAAHVPDL